MATTYEWVRHPGGFIPFGGVTEDVANAFGTYTSDKYFGTRTIISPVPSTIGVDFTWRTKVVRAGNQLVDSEWKYRDNGGGNRSMHVRNYSNGVPGSWVDKTSELSGMPPGLIMLDSVFEAYDTFILFDADAIEDIFSGTTIAEFDRKEDGVLVAGGIGAPAGKLGIGGFDIRSLAIKNLRAEKVITSLESDENTINIKADIMALPASSSLFPSGWTPGSDADYVLQLGDESGSQTYWGPLSGTASVSTAVAGKVAEIDLDDIAAPGRWDGRDSNGNFAQGLSAFVCQTIADDPENVTSAISRVKGNYCITYRCPSCSIGSNNNGLPLAPTISPAGMPLDSSISYTGFNFERLPASAGFGWASEATSRITLQSGELVYTSSSGSHLRWVEQSGNYLPAFPGNYVEAVVDSGSTTARYKLTFKDQTVLEFDDTGKLRRKLDRNDNAITYSYNLSTGFLEAIEDGNGRALYYSNRADGQPLTLRENDPLSGRLTQFLYYSPSDPDSPNRLARVTDPEGNETDFYYYTEGPLWATIDPQWNLASLYGYDSLNRLYQEEVYGELGRIYYRGYSGVSGRATLEVVEIDLLGSEPDRSTYQEFDSYGNVVRQLQLVDSSLSPPIFNETLFEYNDPNNPNLLTKQIDPNLNVTQFSYTANGNLKTVTDQDGNLTTYVYAEEIDVPLNPKHRNLVREIHRPQVTVSGSPVVYDPTTFEYDSNGNLIKITDAAGKETEITYTADGLVESVTNRLGHTTELVYEGTPFNGDSRHLLQIKTPKGSTATDGFRTISFEYDDYDNVISIKDDLGNESLSEYDGINRPVQLTDPLGKITTNVYAALLLEKVILPPNNGSASSPRATIMGYDASNRLIEVKRDIDSIGGKQTRVRYSHTCFSQLAALTRNKNGTNKSFTFSYDQLGRPVETADTLATPGITTTAYEPYCVGHAVTAARGVRRKFSFDNRCLLTQIESGDIDSGDPLEIINMRQLQEREYDELGRLVKLSQTRSTSTNPVVADLDIYGGTAEERTFEYDELDRLVRLSFEDTSYILWEYDAEGAVTKVTDTNGGVTEYTYFRDGLLKEVTVKRPPASDRTFSYSYDAAGRILAITFPSGTDTIAKFDDGTNTPGSGWDAKGQLIHLRYEKSASLVRLFEYSYDDSGNRASMLDVTPSKAIKWEYIYDWLDRLKLVRRGEAADVGSLPSPLPTLSIYSYDASDNRIELELPEDDLIFTYTLDDADQLISISRQKASDPPELSESFSYDQDGNMTERSDVLNAEVITYAWDDFDKLVKVSSADSGGPTNTVKIDQRYDGNGIRKRKLDKAGNSSAEFTAEISTLAAKAAVISSSSPTISYIMGQQMLGAEVNGNFQYWLSDALGTVRDIIDDSGALIQSYEFNEHGIPMPGSGAASGTFAPKTYQGALSVNDDRNDSGLYLMGHRHYAPELGRFISRDPIGFGGGLNLFNGAGANPVTFVDARGLFIKAILDVQQGLLTVEDYGKCANGNGIELKSRQQFKVFSGDKSAMNDPTKGHVPFIGPVPKGQYYLGAPMDVSETHQELVSGNLHWIPILDMTSFENVHYVKNPNGGTTKRDEFYIHPGLVSQGCVTFKSDIPRGQPGYPGSSSYNRLQELVEKTTPLDVNVVGSTLGWPTVTKHTVHGTLIVR